MASEVKSVSLGLKLHDTYGLQSFVKATTDPRSSQYHHFLSVDDFTATRPRQRRWQRW